MRKRKVHHEEHPDETWLIPYADMLTLLLALFIVMFAMSKIDSTKLEKMSEEFNVIFSGGSAMLENGAGVILPINSPDHPMTDSQIEDDKMTEIMKSLQKEVEEEGYADKVKVYLNREGLEFSIQDIMLFNSGDAKVVDEFSPLLLKISGMLRGLDNNIKIVGHTDNVPIKTGTYRSNWELSSMRAINVMNFMVEKGGLAPEKFSIQAFGEYKPKFDNSKAEGRSQNRRVEIFIDRKYPVDEKKVDLTEKK